MYIYDSSIVLQGVVPPLLPIQPERRRVGQHRMGPLGVAGPHQLGRPEAGDRAQHRIRQVWLLVRVGDHAARRHAGDHVHGREPSRRQLPGPEHRVPSEQVGPAAPGVGEALAQPHHRAQSKEAKRNSSNPGGWR